MPRKFLLTTTICISVVIVVLFSFFYIFTVQNVLIHADFPCVSDKELTEKIAIKGKSIFLISKNQISSLILKNITCIDHVEIKTKLPSTLEISYSGKEPVAKVDSSDFYLSANGLVLKTVVTDKNLPTIFLPQGVEAIEGSKISDSDTLLTLEVTNLLLKSDFVPTNVRIVNDSITVYNQQDSVVIFTTKKQAKPQADSLQKVLAKAKMESKIISKIDMRFDNPIIVFK